MVCEQFAKLQEICSSKLWFKAKQRDISVHKSCFRSFFSSCLLGHFQGADKVALEA